MFTNTYSKFGILTTGILTIGAIVYYYFDGKPPMVTEQKIKANHTKKDTEN